MTNNQPQKDLNQLFNAYDAHTHVIRSRIEAYARLAWRALPDYYEKNIEAFVNELVPRVQAAQDSIAVLTDKYLSESAEVLGFGPSSGEIISDEISEGIRGVTPEEVYYRPAREVYRALGEGKTLEEATHAGELRLMSLIGSDIQMTRTHQLVRSYRRSGGSDGGGKQGPQYYRRVLTGRENCALCIVVSTQRYKVDKVMPVHPGCDCGFQPLPPGMTPAQVLDPDLLELVHKTVEERTGQSNRGATGYHELILTVEHSEHGKILGWAPTGSKKIKKSLIPKAEDQAHVHSKADSKYARTRTNPRNMKQMQGIFKAAVEDIRKVRAVPNGFHDPTFEYVADIKQGDVRSGLIRGVFDGDTYKIRINPLAKHIGLTPFHELGHAVDWFLGGKKGFLSEVKGSPVYEIVWKLRETDTGNRVVELSGPYLNENREIFARAYAQYVASQFPDSEAAKEVSIMIKEESLRQWTAEEFQTVIPLFERLFGI